MANKITDRALQAQKRGKPGWLSDGGSRGAGRLQAIEAKFYFAYFNPDGKRRFWPIGPYDSSGARGVTLRQARDSAAELSALYRNGAPDLHAHFERERDAEERARRAEQDAARRAQEHAQRSTLRLLLDGYVGHLEGAKKQCAGDVRRIFGKHVYKAAPDLAERAAAEITEDDCVDLISKVVKAGPGRTAAKLRSFGRAAYALAIKAKTDPAAPLALRAMRISHNPFASLDALSQFNRTRERNLDAHELRAFLKRLEAVPQGVKKSAVELCLLLGGQRPAQLLRARPIDVDLSAATLTLFDRKGKRKEPRVHIVPLTKKPVAILRRLLDGLPDGAAFIFTTDGTTAMRPETASEVVTDISVAMVKAKEAREAFELRDIRKTCETRLAALGVSSDVRAMILSHGLGGVQKRHYDFHDYALEMRAALEKWQRHLDALAAGKSAKVLPISAEGFESPGPSH